ncbi:Uncharacterised protein [Chlamydia trachomatis]|nr:Uncharacterised protein [Chlamydia trachomatis]
MRLPLHHFRYKKLLYSYFIIEDNFCSTHLLILIPSCSAKSEIVSNNSIGNSKLVFLLELRNIKISSS